MRNKREAAKIMEIYFPNSSSEPIPSHSLPPKKIHFENFNSEEDQDTLPPTINEISENNNDCSSSDTDNGSYIDPNESFIQKIRQWSLKNNISNSALNELLTILRDHDMFGYPDVFSVGVYEGYSKPKDVNEYIMEFVNEAKLLLENGICFENKLFEIKIGCFIMDAPARSFVLGIKGHNGYFSCTRCIQKGSMYKNRVVFPYIENIPSRDDISFRHRAHPEHHNIVSVIESLPIDMLQQIGLDYIHIICLGVKRTLLKAWARKKGEMFSLNSWHISNISTQLISLKNCVPIEFSRKPRSLDDLERWKATELRQFLLYYGPLILRPILSKEIIESRK
ncbi:hypothetical protein CVS40_11942 [Lucilia cuprina]|nr:hypothetical protein CVS40_11942 [Lucilia cuprina]